MMSAKTMTRVSLDMAISHHKRLKILAAKRGISIREFVLECIAIHMENVAAKERAEKKKHPQW